MDIPMVLGYSNFIHLHERVQRDPVLLIPGREAQTNILLRILIKLLPFKQHYSRRLSALYQFSLLLRIVVDNVRSYYQEVPKYFQISTHFFIETQLVAQFTAQTVSAWTSMQKCAEVYQATAELHTWSMMLPQDWPITFQMDYELVGEAFYINALIEWHCHNKTLLCVPHKAPTVAERWHDAIEACNVAMTGTGQPEWNHACSLCTRHLKNEKGEITAVFRSVVTDGIAMGHPCCVVHDCKEPLPTNKYRYCNTHTDLSDQCAVSNCHSDRDPGFRTCTVRAHCDAEEQYEDRGKAMFQLKSRLADIYGEPQPTYDEEDSDDDGGPQGNCVIPPSLCDDKPAGGHRRLCVASCGVILGRATFYGAEGLHSVRVFWKLVFPNRRCLPSIMWFDNNCGMAAMLQASGDTYFDEVALPVDVFHFKSKHKQSDGYCGWNCNPAHWPELMDKTTGKWLFNSSAAKQANHWLGGFRAMTRLMRADRYNFLLDEIVMCRNRHRVTELGTLGHGPYSIPREDLLS
ncbi:hypothetical protein K439DRAFT_1664598 [Ramaria rubella]|nr:hypothetical protein K439DRAFT_1664598 [Ramaria rubella]